MNGMEYERQSLADVVFNSISKDIINGVLKESDKLPSESQLCELYDVSRVSIRSAIQKLQAQGLVHTRPGKGTYILSNHIGAAMMRNMTRTLDISEREYMEIIELRQTIEYKALELFIKRGTREDFLQLEESLEEMKNSLDDYRKFAAADLKFHFAIIEGSHNRLFFDIIQSCRDALAKYYTEMSRVNFDGLKDPTQKHQEIVDALKCGNAELAQKLMLGVIETNIKNNIGHLRE